MIKITPQSLQREKDKSYIVTLKADVINDLIKFLKNFKHQFSFEKIVIVTDHQVKKIVGKKLHQKLSQQFNQQVLLISVSPGEKSKSAEGKNLIEKKMLLNHCNRNTVMIALGGGVIGDLTGFTAATYMRGVPYIQMPTTLLAMVDSSVGGKTAINHECGKNLIGLFYQPCAVFADIAFLEALPQKQFICGLIEAIKIFLTYDKKMVEFFLKNISTILSRKKSSTALLQKIILRAIQLKAEVVSRDEKESGERAVLNFGHTIGHAIEKESNYKILHGMAVGYGILIESKISESMGFLSPADRELIKMIFLKLGISIKNLKLKPYKIDVLIKATALDKKNKNNQVGYILLKNIGKVLRNKNQFVQAVPEQIVKTVLKSFMSEE